MKKDNENAWITQVRKGTYEIAIMQLLQEKDMYGYDISASLKEIYDYSISPGAIYPIMKRLEESEWIESYWKKSNEGPNRKYYVLTKKGEVDRLHLIRQMD